MAKFANTANLDLNADVYSGDEADLSSGSDAEDSDDSARYEDSELTAEFLLGYDLLLPAKLS